MPRPLRIEYEDAYYHVMNRGRARQTIFPETAYFEAFLATLGEAHQRFNFQVLCYCLMTNHYHLLVKTPDANLGRAMRHINGVYTQRHNRLKNTDGPLFRGRYKAICIEQDSYQLQVSRYIHRNPLEANVVHELDQYPWSSYRYYVHRTQPPPGWLYRSDIYDQLGVKRQREEKYRAYVELGIDEEIQQFYGKGNLMPYLGSDEFRAWAYNQRATEEAAVSHLERRAFRPSVENIIERVAHAFEVSPASIRRTTRGGSDNVPRWVAMYLCQEVGACRLVEIAAYFGLQRTGSIPTTIRKLKCRMETDKKLERLVDTLSRGGV